MVLILSFQCKAIFFSEQERLQHTCLSSPTESLPASHGGLFSVPLNFFQSSTASKNGTVLLTSASPQNLIRPQYFHGRNPGISTVNHLSQCASGLCDCSRNQTESTGRSRTGSFCVCSSCGKSYENSGDSLSGFDLSVDSAAMGGHRCPNSPSVRGCVNDLEGMYVSSTLPSSPKCSFYMQGSVTNFVFNLLFTMQKESIIVGQNFPFLQD